MKKYLSLIGLVVLIGAAIAVYAGDVTQSSSWYLTEGKRITALKDVVETDLPAVITELNSVNNLTDGTGALSALTGLVAGKGVVVGESTGTYMTILTNVTMHAGTIWTQAFSTVYSVTPMVIATYTEDPGDVRPLFITSATPSNVLVNAAADKNFNLVIIGQK